MATGYSNRSRSVTAQGVCSRCKDPILWVTIASSGRRVPLNPAPDPAAGEVYVVGAGASWRIGFTVRDEGLRAELREHGHGVSLHRFHSDTCVKARPKPRYPD